MNDWEQSNNSPVFVSGTLKTLRGCHKPNGLDGDLAVRYSISGANTACTISGVSSYLLIVPMMGMFVLMNLLVFSYRRSAFHVEDYSTLVGAR